jgi:hypothetical protein
VTRKIQRSEGNEKKERKNESKVKQTTQQSAIINNTETNQIIIGAEQPYMTRKVHPCNPPSTAAAACAAANQP